MSAFDELCILMDSKGIDREIFIKDLTTAANSVGCSVEEVARFFLTALSAGVLPIKDSAVKEMQG